jgi:Tol biopolymer transport system component
MLATGKCFGDYEVLELLGSGGMGEVFRARDARLGRDVAIKVLPERFTLDTQRRARFEREARVLAALNHPNIAMLHAVEPMGEGQVLVLELVEGETLAQRIARGPIPVPEALAIARQVAAALEAAHERGVIHRDLKPSNIKLRSDGTVKLLDFGLAKAFDPVVDDASAQAITVTIEVAGGTILGTPAYMSPEHARGLPVDKRADIWAFGCVLYEMLTGKAAFQAERASDVVAKIIEREPDFDVLPREVPGAVRQLLRRCLRKDSRERLRDIGDARLTLEEVESEQPSAGRWGEGSADDSDGAHGASWGRGAKRENRRSRAVLAAIALAAVAGVVLIDVALRLREQPVSESAPAPITRFSMPAAIVPSPYARALAISRDGARFAYISERGLVVRARDRVEMTELSLQGDSSFGAPFFSPDGQWIAYYDGQRLMKAPADGGPAVAIVDVGPAAIGDWSGSGIVYADMNGVFRVSPDGGVAQRLAVELGSNEQALFPQFIPGTNAVIFTVVPTRTLTPADLASLPSARVDVLDLTSGSRRTLLRGGGRAQYIPTGHLVYLLRDALYAVAFDAGRLEVRGAAVQVASGIRNAEFALADDGTLVYHTGGPRPDNTLVWVDRQGREEPLGAPPRRYIYPRVSPDGTRVALDVQGPADRDIWIWDLQRRTLERFTVDPTGNPLVAWSRDSKALAFGSDRFGVTNLFLQSADGSGEPQRLLVSERLQMPLTFAPDGRLLFSADIAGRGRDILALSMDGSGRTESVLNTAANDLTAEVSPDGRWIVYDSDETGQFEVYVRPYPHTYSSGRWQISSGGGRQPMWSADGGEIFYRDFDGAMWALPVTLQPAFRPGVAARLFGGEPYLGRGRLMSGRTYDLSPDGRRFLMIRQETDAEGAPSLIVVLNWFEELKRAVPAASGGQGRLR